MPLPRRSLILFGLGPHARRIYYPMLERARADYDVDIAVLVELEDQRSSVEEYLASRALQPGRIVYLPSAFRDLTTLPATFLDAVSDMDDLWGAVVATEPRAHKLYAQWAVDRGLHVLLDKPVTALDLRGGEPEAALRLVDDYFDLRRAADRAGTTFTVMTQRRAHLGYEMIRSYLQEFLGSFGVPITYLDVYHADGMWNMPDEFLSRENHPYKYGYGKVMHSGYHFLDLVSWLLELNAQMPAGSADRLELLTRHNRPYDFLSQVGVDRYAQFFGSADNVAHLFSAPHLGPLRDFGETDVYLLAQLMRGDAAVTTASVNLLQTSFSRRAWPTLPKDTYKGNGRVRHERLTAQVGHLLNVQVHSYQSYEAADRAAEDAHTGNYDHFDIYFFRNTALVGGKPFECINLGDALQRSGAHDAGYLGHNEAAREELIADFLALRAGRSPLSSHELPVKLAAAAYYSMLARNAGHTVLSSLDLTAAADNWLLATPLASRPLP